MFNRNLRSELAKARKSRHPVRGKTPVLPQRFLGLIGLGTKKQKPTQRQVVNLLKRKILTNPKFLSQLPRVVGGDEGIRRFVDSEKNIDVIIKKCERETRLHGWDYERYNNFYNTYRDDVKGGSIEEKNYLLVKLRAYGKFKLGLDRYLIMENIEQMDMAGRTNYEHWNRNEAYQNLYNNIQRFRKLHPEIKPPQVDMICLGNTNPENPIQGKWIFALPHDT